MRTLKALVRKLVLHSSAVWGSPVDPYRHKSVDGDDDWGVLHRHGNGAEPGRKHPLVQHEPKHNKQVYIVWRLNII